MQNKIDLLDLLVCNIYLFGLPDKCSRILILQ